MRRRTLTPGKVALISGGGSGHEPLHAGFVGPGMLDAACPGQIFTSPTPDQMAAAVEAVDQGAGVVFIVKNYEGDVMNFEMAAEMTDGRCVTVLIDDDVAVEKSTYSTGRRGVAGTLVVEKLVGAAAEQGRSLADLQALGPSRQPPHALDGRRADVLHRARRGQAELRPRRQGDGNGRRHPWRARPATHCSCQRACDRRRDGQGDPRRPEAKRGSEALLFINGFGGTPLIELYLLYHEAARLIEAAGVKPARSLVGSYVTSLDMAGASITVSIFDGAARALWDAPVRTAALRCGL